MSRVTEIWSGGQCGVDQAGLIAAKKLGIKTGGWAPWGYRCFVKNNKGNWVEGTEPKLAEYGLKQTDSSGYKKRTVLNVQDTDGTLWVGNTQSPGGKLTLKTAAAKFKPVHLVLWRSGEGMPGLSDIKDFILWLNVNDIRRLNVAGNREHTQPGITRVAHDFIVAALG